ncbi:MAG: hypothetical protein IPK13_20225 [Deltaproteobacteria bacterium]|nr:hypothetical protein [Deltaproteobacteria bacterium]
MALNLQNLDAAVRALMITEIEEDEAGSKLYFSPRLSATGLADYARLLKEAASTHDDDWLASQLRTTGRLNTTEQRKKPKGGYTTAAVPVTAADTLAEGEFNRFYARALCRHAIDAGISDVEVYRAKAVSAPRPESEAMLGKRISAKALLDDLRKSQGVEPALGLPPGPNSGLSVKLS